MRRSPDTGRPLIIWQPPGVENFRSLLSRMIHGT